MNHDPYYDKSLTPLSPGHYYTIVTIYCVVMITLAYSLSFAKPSEPMTIVNHTTVTYTAPCLTSPIKK